MKGTIIDFLGYLNENEDLRKEVVEVANKHGFEFTDEVSDAELESVAGGVLASPLPSNVVLADNTTSFEDFDQKTDQLFNVLSTVMKSMQDIPTRNIL